MSRINADVDLFLDVVLSEVRAVLGSEFVGMYVEGSIALGDFDKASDIDVVVVTRGSAIPYLGALDIVHRRLARRTEWFATQLECIYMSMIALRRFDPAQGEYLKLDRGPGEVLKIDRMDESWIVHCYVLRNHGIAWSGPEPSTLIDDVSPDDLRDAMRGILRGWFTDLLRDSTQLKAPGYQSYAVLSLCRILYTLESGMIGSKLHAAKWAAMNLPEAWRGLIERAIDDRLRNGVCAADSLVSQTLDVIKYARSRVDQ